MSALQEVGNQRLDAKDWHHLDRQLGAHRGDVEHRQGDAEIENQRFETDVSIEFADVLRVTSGDGRVACLQHGIEIRLHAEEPGQIQNHPLEVEGVALASLQLLTHLIGPGDTALLQVLARAAAKGRQVGELFRGNLTPVEEGMAVDVDDRQAIDLDHSQTISR